MSIVAVHGPHTFGSQAVVETGPLMAVVNPANGLIWDFKLDKSTTRLNADFSWAFPTNGTPTPQALADPTPVTYATPGAKTVTLTVTGAGTGADPYPPAGVYTMVVNAVAGVAPRMAGPPEGEEEYDPGDHNVDEVVEYATTLDEEGVRALLEAELNGKNRITLVSQLEGMLPYDPGDDTVQEVVDYATNYPDQLEGIIAAEEAGKNRSTLLSQLYALRP